jgi:hypothetical protein
VVEHLPISMRSWIQAPVSQKKKQYLYPIFLNITSIYCYINTLNLESIIISTNYLNLFSKFIIEVLSSGSIVFHSSQFVFDIIVWVKAIHSVHTVYTGWCKKFSDSHHCYVWFKSRAYTQVLPWSRSVLF